MFYWQGGKFPNDYFLQIRRDYLQDTWPKMILILLPPALPFNQNFPLPAYSDDSTNNIEHTLILAVDTNTIWVLKYNKTA